MKIYNCYNYNCIKTNNRNSLHLPPINERNRFIIGMIIIDVNKLFIVLNYASMQDVHKGTYITQNIISCNLGIDFQ